MSKRLRKLKPKKDNTIDLINKALYEKERKRALDPSYIPKPSHKPSSFGSKCLRNIYYTYWKVPPDKITDSKGLRIFDTGNYLELMVVDWLKMIGEHIPNRNKTNGNIPKDRLTGKEDPQFWIKAPAWRIRSGKIDNIGFRNGELWLYEIKTKKAEKWEKLLGPDPEHLEQGSIYLQAFNDLMLEGKFKHIPEFEGKKIKATGIRYLYINKNTTEIKEFSIKISDLIPLILKINKKAQEINSYIDSKVLPPKNTKECFFCPFYKKCKEDWNDIDSLLEARKKKEEEIKCRKALKNLTLE